MFVDKGLNDKWVRPKHWQAAGRGQWRLVLQEQLGQSWADEIVAYPLPAKLQGVPEIAVTCAGRGVPCQVADGRLHLLVESLGPREKREFLVSTAAASAVPATADMSFSATATEPVLGNGLLAVKLAGTHTGPFTGGSIPGPIVAVSRRRGPWLGRGRLDCRHEVLGISTRLVEQGALWWGAEVVYRLADGMTYRVLVRLRPGDEVCEVREDSDIPVRLWPAPRPYREIGSLGTSFWVQSRADIAKPCPRPCPTTNFIFDLRHGFAPARLVTHSTSSWEIMDMPLGLPALKTYTAMRPAIPFVDGGWLSVYDPQQDDLLGVASLDVAHWSSPDESIHPAHRTPGASAEVLLVDGAEAGTHLRFPVERLHRRWLCGVFSRQACVGIGTGAAPGASPVRLEANPDMPLWRLRRRRGDLSLDKIKDWSLDWPERGGDHPRLYCRKADFPAIRAKVQDVPELRANWERTRQDHSADRHLMGENGGGLAAIEAATKGKELVENILARGYTGPIYAIGLARPLRRYVVACDIQWDSFTAEEKRTARWVCAAAAYILTDGDWWQYVFRPGETTYLPNFNSDVFCCAGLMGMFLTDHPCAKVWTQQLVRRMDIELKHHLREDGGGEENVGNYLLSTWTQLYLPALWALRHCGVKDYSSHPAILGGARFLLKALGPRDPRDGGRRMMPPIGHHPHARKALTFVPWLASFIKGADATLAGHLMWGWRETGAIVFRNFDHSGPLAEPFTRHYVMHDPTIPEIPPPMESCNLPHVGAVLRSHDGSGLGSYLFLKAGRVHSHHDDDEGSFHWFGRGVPLAQDGLPLQNGAKAHQHNAVTFTKPGQPTALVDAFVTTPGADYVRAVTRPRAFCCDPNYYDDTHRSGCERQIVFVKARQAGGIEYLVVKDVACGPEACQWNLDVLSRRPELLAPGHLWFPGHAGPGFDTGLDVFVCEPDTARIEIEEGTVNEKLKTAEGRAGMTAIELAWTVNEHWLMHLPAGPGTTFVTVLFPRRHSEAPPVVEYLRREEVVAVTHCEGRDLIFLRPNAMVGVGIDGVVFQGQAGMARRAGNSPWLLYPFLAERMETEEAARRSIHTLGD